MKGKKFDAAEKHFMKKQAIYEHRIENYRNIASAAEKKYDDAQKDIEKLKQDNKNLSDLIEYMSTQSGMSKEDMRKAWENTAKARESLESLMFITNTFKSFM